MPPLPKPPARRQGRHRHDVGTIAASATFQPPAPPAGLLAALSGEWERLWSSPLATTFTTSDVPALERLFELRDEAVRHQRAARRTPTVEGSKGQVVLNPVLRQRDALLAEIRQLEDRFGLSPRSRLQLGITLSEAHRSLDDLNRSYVERDGGHDPRDPRTAA